MINTCSICLTDLASENAVALCCGHLFHKSCLDSWLESNNSTGVEYTCPLCRRSTPIDRAVWPLFFARAGDASSTGSSSATEEKVAALQRELAEVKENLSRVTHQLSLKDDQFEKTKYALQKKTEQEARAQVTLRYLKELRRVSDLDAYMEMPTTQEYLSGLSRRPRPELVTAVGALRAKCAQYARERDLASKKCDIAVQQKKAAERRIEALQKEIREFKAASGKSKQFNPDHFIKYGQPSSPKDIVVIDSDEDTDDEEFFFTLGAPRSSSSGSTVATEEVKKDVTSTRKGKEVVMGSTDRERRLGFLGKDVDLSSTESLVSSGRYPSPEPARRSSPCKRDREDDDVVESVSKTRRL